MMDSRKKITQFIGPSIPHGIIAWTSLLLTVAFLLTGIVLSILNGRTEAQRFDAARANKARPYYIDVVGVSDWFMKEVIDNRTHQYCVVLDSDNYYNVVELSVNDLYSMSEQQAYWRGDSDVAPEPFRLSGWAMPINDKSDLPYSLYRISGAGSFEEVEATFGTMYLTTFHTGSLDLYFLGALVFGMIALFTLAFYLGTKSRMKKSLRELEAAGRIDLAAEELENCPSVGRCAIGTQFLFVKHQGIATDFDSIRKCVVHNDGVELITDSLGRFIVKMKPEIIAKLVDALQNKKSESESSAFVAQPPEP